MLKNIIQNIKKQEKDYEVKMKIESLQNKKVKEWTKLKEKKYRDEKNVFLIEGDHLIKEAEKANCIQEIIGLESEKADYNVTIEIMKKITSQITPPKMIAVCQKIQEKEPFGNILILDALQDPGNLGTIIRSAVAFSYDTIILSENSVDLYNEKVIRSTEGMLFHINIIRRNLKEVLPKLKQMDYQIYGTNVVKGKKISECQFKNKKAILIGNEGRGVRKEFQTYFDETIYIPMNQKCESLNAAISASIIMYESEK